jgi:hypothetical protein
MELRPESAMQHIWWPLQSGIALCETQDPLFAADVAMVPDSHKKIELYLTVRLGRRVDVGNHWRLLGSLIDNDRVRADGTAQDRWFDGLGRNGEIRDYPRGILPAGAGEDLVPWDDKDKDGETWLAPHNRLLLRGQGRFWNRVRVHRPDLMAALGHIAPGSSLAKKRGPQAEKVYQAFEEALAAGKKRDDLLASPSDLMRIAGAFLRGDKDHQPDPRTFQWVWKQMQDTRH